MCQFLAIAEPTESCYEPDAVPRDILDLLQRCNHILVRPSCQAIAKFLSLPRSTT